MPVLAALTVSCAARQYAPASCAPPAVAVSGWREAGGTTFVLRVPPGFQTQRVQGIDSEVGEWSDGDGVLSYDYGRYSDRLERTPEGAREVSQCEATVGGRPARVVRYRNAKGEYVVAAHWPVAAGGASRRDVAENTLTVNGVAHDARKAELLLAALHSVRFRAGTSASAPSVGQLAWMTGCWERRSTGRLVEEHWMAPRGGIMLGTGRTTRGDSLVEYEQTRIFERAGRLVFAATPSGQAPAEFEATEASDTAVTFSNPTHDFPQRVMYRRRGADSLLARVEGQRGGQLRGVDFPYGRVRCGGGDE